MAGELSTTTTRRRVLGGAAGLLAVGALGVSSELFGACGSPAYGGQLSALRRNHVRTRDGTLLHYKSSGTGPVILFSHGWRLSSDAWEDQLFFFFFFFFFFFASHGFQAIAHDRRGHGHSAQPWQGNDIDTHADDLADLIEALDLRQITLVGHSTGGGEVARYIGRHGTGRLRKAVLVSGIPPLRLPIGNSARLQERIIRGAKLSVYDGAPHGLTVTHRDRFNAELLSFARS